MLESIQYFVAVYALLWYMYENLKAPLIIALLVLKEKLFGIKWQINLKSRFGEWAVITGASDGIGKGYALELARRGLNIVLIARNENKLKQVADEIMQETGVQTKIMVADFSQMDIYEEIDRQLQSISVGILVNNVGCNTSEITELAAAPVHEVWQVLHTNTAAVTFMSRLMARQWHSRGIKGCIVNISSITQLVPMRYAALYSASKAYTRALSVSLRQELKPYGITVQIVAAGFVITKINSYSKKIMSGCLFIPDVKTYIRYAVDTIGHLDDTSGYHWHGVQTAVMKALPESVRCYIVRTVSPLLVDEQIRLLQ